MKKIVTSYIFLLILISCINKKENINDLEFEILNDTLVAFPYEMGKDTINVLNYSIKNNSNHIYYFKQGSGNDFLYKKVYKNGLYLNIFERTSNKEVDYSDKLPFEHQNRSNCDSCCNFIQSIRLIKETERLKENDKISYYSTKDKRHYFFIHPKEKLFFKQYINLTDSMRYEDTRFNYAHLKKKLNYYSKLFIPSDSNNYKNVLPKDILKTIEANNVKVYHGIIESKNKIPIKVLE
jgi:hypothetical protein